MVFHAAVMADLSFPSILRVGKGGLGVFKFTAQQLGWKCTDVALSPDEVAYPAQEVLSVE